MDVKCGINSVISEKAILGEGIVIGHNCIIEDDVVIGDNTYIDSNVIIRAGVGIGKNSNVGANCIIGEYGMDFYEDHQSHKNPLYIGEKALIRSGSIIYAGSEIGKNFQTGHRVTIREKTQIGDNVSIGTLSDIQGNCKIGNYVRLHSNVHIGQLSEIDDFVWIYPYVVLTNDPTPPSENFIGVHVHSFAIVATSAVVMPGIEIGSDSLVAAGAIVTKNVEEFNVVGGSPAKVISDVRKIKNRMNGEAVYPWRFHFSRAMPWSETDYTSWYNSLSIDERKEYGLSEHYLDGKC